VAFLLQKQPVGFAPGTRGLVVLVHGLWMTGAVCALQRLRLARLGYRATAFSYSSTRSSLQQISSQLLTFTRKLHQPRMHFVAHSLGGLVVLEMLARHPELEVGRVVLLGTPCAGSRVAQHMARWKAGRALVGSALLEWQPEHATSVMQRCEVGMIAGTMSVGMGRLVAPLPGPNDGAVCVQETQLPGLRDHLTLPVSHSAMMVSEGVMRQICNFLERGGFAHD
jgi:pimeloyl-ACP methyl ester carboxylesterase